MRYLVVLCCLLFAWRGGGDEVLYFDGYVTLKSDTAGGLKETNAKAQYVFKGAEDAFFELKLIVDDDPENPLIISGLIRRLEGGDSVAVHSADGKYQIGTGKLKDDGEAAVEMTFDLLIRGMKVSDVKLEQKVSVGYDDPGVYLNFKLSALAGDVEANAVYFEGNLPLDLTKSMRCSVDAPADDC